MPELLAALDRKCSCTQPHAPWAGVDIRLTESYTDGLASAIHVGFANFCREKRGDIFMSEINASDISACGVPFDQVHHFKPREEGSPGPSIAGGAQRPTGVVALSSFERDRNTHLVSENAEESTQVCCKPLSFNLWTGTTDVGYRYSPEDQRALRPFRADDWRTGKKFPYLQ